MNRLKTYRILLSIMGLVIFGLILYLGGIESLKHVIRADLLYLGCVFVFTGMITYINSLRWGMITNSLEKRKICSFRNYFHYQIMSRAVSLVVSRNVGDFGARPIAMRVSGSLPLGRALFSSFADKFFDLWLVILCFIPVLLYSMQIDNFQAFAFLLLISITAGSAVVIAKFTSLLAIFMKLIEVFSRKISRLPFLGKLMSERRLKKINFNRQNLAKESNIAAKAQFLTLLKFMGMIFRAYFISKAIGFHVPFWAWLVAVPIAQASALVAITPSGLGILEMGWYGALLLVGVNNLEITAFVIGQRAYIASSVIILAFLSYLMSSLLKNSLLKFGSNLKTK